MRAVYFVFALILTSTSWAKEPGTVFTEKEQLHQHVCQIAAADSDSPWHIKNLYDCKKAELFVPYQLWTGSAWDGDKRAACTHPADIKTSLEKPSDDYLSGEIVISGPESWEHPKTGDQLQVWKRSLSQYKGYKYYYCHSRGIGTIFRSKKPDDIYLLGLCHAPGGDGWVIGMRRTCIKTTLEIDEIELDSNNQLISLSVKYWFRDKLRYRYRYEPGRGTTQIFSY